MIFNLQQQRHAFKQRSNLSVLFFCYRVFRPPGGSRVLGGAVCVCAEKVGRVNVPAVKAQEVARR